MKRIASCLLLLCLVPACRVELHDSRLLELGEQATREERHALELAPADVLTLLTTFGKTEVHASAAGPAELRATLRASGRTPEEAEAVLARCRLELARDAHGLRVELVGEPLEVQSGSARSELHASVEFSATVPVGTALAVRSGAGDILTRGELGELELETSFGTIHVEAASGAVHAKSNSGDVRIDSGGSGALELTTAFGRVSVGHAAGGVRASSKSGDVELRDVSGTVEAESGFGQVVVDGVLHALRATSNSGNVRVAARAGSRVESPWELHSDFGRVELVAPADFTCRLDARTGFGSVECDFPVTIEAGKQQGNTLAGTIGAGGERVTLHSGSGDVALKKR